MEKPVSIGLTASKPVTAPGHYDLGRGDSAVFSTTIEGDKASFAVISEGTLVRVVAEHKTDYEPSSSGALANWVSVRVANQLLPLHVTPGEPEAARHTRVGVARGHAGGFESAVDVAVGMRQWTFQLPDADALPPFLADLPPVLGNLGNSMVAADRASRETTMLPKQLANRCDKIVRIVIHRPCEEKGQQSLRVLVNGSPTPVATASGKLVPALTFDKGLGRVATVDVPIRQHNIVDGTTLDIEMGEVRPLGKVGRQIDHQVICGFRVA